MLSLLARPDVAQSANMVEAPGRLEAMLSGSGRDTSSGYHENVAV